MPKRSKSPVPSSRPVSVSRSRLESASTAALRLKTSVYVSQPASKDDEAGHLFTEWLQLPSVAQETEDELAMDTERKYATEPTFDTSNIYGHGGPSEFREALGPVNWRRVTGQLYIPTSHQHRLVSGCVADHRWFLGALAAVSCRRELLLDLFQSDEQAAHGIYTFCFFKHGKWRSVVVDNLLPCMELQQRLAFCSSSQAQELWPSLIEKAYARLHGGYPALAAGSVADALVDLTGGVLAAKVDLSQEGQMAEAAAGTLWSQIIDWLAAGSLIVCVAKQPKQSQPGSTTAAGIALNSPYSILAAKKLTSGTKLLQLHCPWSPEGMWQGPWSAESAEWHSDEGQAALAEDEVLAAGLDDPATFWCTYWEFIEVFNRCWVVQVLPDSWHQILVAGGWVGPTAGGPATPFAAAAAQCDNTIFSLVGCYNNVIHSQLAQPAVQNHSGNTASQGSIPAGRLLNSTEPQRQQQLQQPLRQSSCTGAQVSVSSSWCCNPQFKLAASGSGQVVICLGQQDPQVLHQGHKPKRLRDFQIGLMVVHGRSRPAARMATGSAALTFQSSRPPSPVECRRASRHPAGCHQTAARRCSTARPGVSASTAAQSTRVWAPGHSILADSGISSSREVVLRFSVEQGQIYTLVPYTRQAGETGPFALRIYSPHAMQLEQLPSPLSLVIGGQWAAHMAGGCRCHHQSWGNNPQYLISCQRETTAIIALVRPDVSNSLLPQPFDPKQCIGITVCTPQNTAEGLGRRAAVWDAAGQVYVESDFTTMDEVVLLVQLQPEVPYLLVPSTAEPGIEAPFELRVLSEHPVELMPLPEVHTISCIGEWSVGRAGGCNMHHSWTTNPAFLLRLQRRSACKVSIKRLRGCWSHNESLGEMVGFYVIKHVTMTDATHKAAEALKSHQLYESVFLPAADCEAELELPAGTPLLLVPCTYTPNIHGSFLVTVTAMESAGLTVEPITGGLAAAIAPTVIAGENTRV